MNIRLPVSHSRRLLVGVFCALLGWLCSAQAYAVCIASGDATALQSALNAAAAAGSSVTIKLERGTYIRHGDIFSSPEDDVQILGGYAPTQGHTCDEAQRVVDASKTTLSIDGEIFLDSAPGTLTRLADLTIDSQAANGGLGLKLFGDTIELIDVRVTHQRNFYAVHLGYETNASSIFKLINVQFDHLLATGAPGCGVFMELAGHGSASIDHATVDLSGGDFCFDSGATDGNKHVSLWNSIAWDSTNAGGSIAIVHSDIDDPITLELRDVDYPDIEKLAADTVLSYPEYPNAQFDPLWANPGAGDYTLVGGANSVAVNTGTIDFPAGEPDTDIFGIDWPIGSRPDMGAHESPYDDIAGGNVFVVTNTNDIADENSPLYSGSLRAALQKASTLSGPSLVKFALPACPSIITLNSPLPLVWEPLIIDGYSMPGSSANSDPSSFFNATLCVALQPANTATTPSALIVPSGGHEASLTVKGLGFGGFSQAIQLWGGYSHQIVGNQFGGVMNGVQLFGFDTAGVRIETSGSVIVGGSSVADHNVFQNANSSGDAAGVVVGVFTDNAQTACQIVGNLFGITPDGFSAIPNNKYGILLQGNGCLVEGNRMAGNIKDAIYILGGNNHVIQNNVIGPAMFFGQDFSNPGAGIRIAAGGANNIIGAPPGFGGSYYANDIKDMDLGGVLIGGDGGGNSIRGNRIADNGLSTGLNLDLGLDGPTANDPGDIDSGANGLMNYPKAHAFGWTSGTPMPGTFNIPGHIQGLVDLAPGPYQLDAYYDDSCGAAGRGGGGWVGGVSIDIAAAGAAPFDVPVTIPAYDAAHGQVSLAATSLAGGQSSTSEFSECLSVDSIFFDGFER